MLLSIHYHLLFIFTSLLMATNLEPQYPSPGTENALLDGLEPFNPEHYQAILSRAQDEVHPNPLRIKTYVAEDAILLRNLPALKLLLENGAEVGQGDVLDAVRDSTGSPYTWPEGEKHAVVKLLLQYGANPNSFRLLLDLVQNGEINTLNLLLPQVSAATLNSFFPHYMTLMKTAIISGRPEIIKALHRHGVDLREEDFLVFFQEPDKPNDFPVFQALLSCLPNPFAKIANETVEELLHDSQYLAGVDAGRVGRLMGVLKAYQQEKVYRTWSARRVAEKRTNVRDVAGHIASFAGRL